MPAMSRLESAICSSRVWDAVVERRTLPWVLGGEHLGDANVVEVGGGDGSMATRLLRREPGITLTMVDVDPAMVARARERLAPHGDRATAVEGDVTALPFPDGEFDVALSFLMLHHVERWERAIDELARMVRPGGRLLVYDILDTRLNRWLHELTKSRVRLLRGDDVRGLARDERLRDARTRISFGQAFRLAATRA